MIPHTIVVEPGLLIYKIYMGYWFFGRPTMEELRQDLRSRYEKCRPAWDITAPELKAARNNAVRNSSIRMAKSMSKLSASRFRNGVITLKEAQ